MKRHIFNCLLLIMSVIIILSDSINSTAETSTYPPMLVDGREWIYSSARLPDYRVHPNTQYHKLIISGDTVVNDVICKRIEDILYVDERPYLRCPDEIMYETDGVVYQFVDDEFHEIMNMGLKVGDHYRVNGELLDVVRVDNVIINGESRKRIFVGADENAHLSSWIEGIGCSDLRIFSQSNKGTSGPVVIDGSVNRFSHISENGRELACCNDFHAEDSTPLTRSDNIWVYGGFDLKNNSAFKSYFRFGDYKFIGDFSYREFHEFKRVTWPDMSNPLDSVVDSGNHIPSILLRDQCGIIYGPPVNVNPNVPHGMFEFPIIYDFGEEFLKFPSMSGHLIYIPVIDNSVDGFNFMDYYCKYNYREMEPVEIAGQLRKRYKLIDYSPGAAIECIEGIGITTMGYLPYIFRPFTIEEAEAPRLLEYCDAEGKVLHKFASMPWESSAVTAIQAGDESEEGTLFDLHGRKVTTPQQGSIYIRNGKKIIFR